MKTTNPEGPITDREHPDYDPDLDPDNFIPCEICGAEAACGCDAEWCANCEGEGYTDESFQEMCEDCEGTGKIPF